MTPDVCIRPCEALDIFDVHRRLREADRVELIAGMSMAPLKTMLMTYDHSVASWAGKVDGTVACVYGVCQTTVIYGGQGCPWMFTTALVERNPIPFLRGSRRALAKMLELFPYLENWVDARNVHAVSWLKWLGFEMDEPQPYGSLQRPFHRFYMGEK